MAAKGLEGETGVAERAADVQVVAGARARAQQRRAVRNLAEHRDADRQRAARRVAADQLAFVRIGERQQAARESLEEARLGPWQRQRQREGERRGPARREVAEVDRERLVAEPIGRDGRQEVAALDEHVARDGELMTGPRHEQRAIVADAERDATCRPGEVPVDELELADRHEWGRYRRWSPSLPALSERCAVATHRPTVQRGRDHHFYNESAFGRRR